MSASYKIKTMDTKFWGPDAWRFLHCVADNCPDTMSNNKQLQHHRFFNVLQDILPCIFCRRSLTKFYDEIPINVSSGKCTRYWFYRIHNRVNNKLRKQGVLSYKNPPASDVYEYYQTYKQKCIDQNIFPGWDFLYTVCLNYPEKTTINDPKRRAYKRFFTYLADVMPYPNMKKKYKQYLLINDVRHHLNTRHQIIKWFHNFQKQCPNSKQLSLTQTKIFYEQYRASCNPKKGICSKSKK